jgi:hypothetical protein
MGHRYQLINTKESMNETENITFRAPKGWKKKLEKIDEKLGASMRPQYGRIIRQALVDKHPELKDE